MVVTEPLMRRIYSCTVEADGLLDVAKVLEVTGQIEHQLGDPALRRRQTKQHHFALRC